MDDNKAKELETLVAYAQIHRNQFNKRRKCEYKLLVGLLTFFVLTASAVASNKVSITIGNISIWLIFILIATLASTFFVNLHSANNINKQIAENCESEIEDILANPSKTKINKMQPSKEKKKELQIRLFMDVLPMRKCVKLLLKILSVVTGKKLLKISKIKIFLKKKRSLWACRTQIMIIWLFALSAAFVLTSSSEIKGNDISKKQEDVKTKSYIGETVLVEAEDGYIPVPERDVDKPFLMAIEDVFSIKGRGTVGTGRVERGKIHVGDEVEIVGLSKEIRKTTCTGIEMFNKTLDEGQAGDNIGVLLRGVAKKDLKRGQVVSTPGSITPHTKFHAEVYILTKEEGGRHTPFFVGYRPQFYFRTTDVTGSVHALMSREGESIEMCMPGDNITMEVEIISPIAMEEGLRFAIREGGRTVGAGVVTKVIE